ncbi:hypothetical protein ACQKGO_39050 [Corallococcus interemptor]|uniref:hypothetical protein n=1 Tax=Corallococcus interemptor TaxID=2316720 RepID=UPI003D059C06
MPLSTIRIATALVQPDYEWAFQSRLSLVAKMCTWLGHNEPQCRSLTGPAGYFRVSSQAEAYERRDEFTRALGDELLTTFTFDLLGDDLSPKKKRALDGKHLSDGHALPFYGCLIDGGKPLGDIVQQLGRKSGDISAFVADAHARHRVHITSLLENRPVALSLCGEVRSRPWREALVEQTPCLILNPAHASVNLAGNPTRSWARHVDELLMKLPQDTAWAFADHITQLEHRANKQFVPLVQGGQGTRARRVNDSGWDIPGARLYVYEVLLA